MCKWITNLAGVDGVVTALLCRNVDPAVKLMASPETIVPRTDEATIAVCTMVPHLWVPTLPSALRGHAFGLASKVVATKGSAQVRGGIPATLLTVHAVLILSVGRETNARSHTAFGCVGDTVAARRRSRCTRIKRLLICAPPSYPATSTTRKSVLSPVA